MSYPFRCWLYPVHAIFSGSGSQTYLLPEIKEGISRASDFGLTAMELAQIETHYLAGYTNFPRIAQSRTKSEMKYWTQMGGMVDEFCAECKAVHLEPYFFDFELAHFKEIGQIYPEALDPTRPLMWEIISERLCGIFERFPDIAGLEVYLDEGEAVNVSHIASTVPPDEVVARLALTYISVCRRYGKKVIFCTFSNKLRRLKDIQHGLKMVPVTDGFVVNQWMVPGDLGEYLAYNPCIGDVGGHPEIITFDFASELQGQCQTPFCYVDYLKDRWADALARSRNIIGYTGWAAISWHYNIAQTPPFVLNTANEVNAFALSKLAENPETSESEIWQEWTSGLTDDPLTASTVIEALRMTREIGEKAWMLKGFWFMEWPKSQLPDLYWALHSPYESSTAEWDASLIPIEDAIFFPNYEVLADIISDRTDAVRMAEKSLEEIRSVTGKLSTPWDRELEASLERLVIFGKLSQYHAELFLRWKMWWLQRPDTEREMLEECANKLENLADEVEQQYGPRIWPGNPTRARQFAGQIRQVMTYGRGPLTKWSSICTSPVGKRCVHSILSGLANLAIARETGTLSAENEDEVLDEVKRLTRQLFELGSGEEYKLV